MSQRLYRGVDWIDQYRDWLTSNWLFTETFMDPFKDLQREIHVQRWRISIYCTYWSPQPAPKLTTWTKEFCLIFTLFQLCKLDHPAISYRKVNTLLVISKRSICQPDDSKYSIFGHSCRRLQKIITYLPGKHGPDWLKMGEHPMKCRALRKIQVTIFTNLCLVCFGNFRKRVSAQRQKI